MKKLYLKEMNTKLGRLRIICDDDFIIRLMFENDNLEQETAKLKNTFCGVTLCGENKLTSVCVDELQGYLDGRLRTFSVKPKFYGTVFDLTVWQGLMGIEYGKTVAYSALAASCGVRGARAVGGAVGRNPVPVIAPCHRVIRSDGGLGGFTGGIQNKQILMTIEGIKFE
jgi:methylated-DNA-[protein]-cysteine S-methyltransferase